MLKSFIRHSRKASFLVAPIQSAPLHALSTIKTPCHCRSMVGTGVDFPRRFDMFSSRRHFCKPVKKDKDNDNTTTTTVKKDFESTTEGGAADARSDLQIHLAHLRQGKTNLLRSWERTEQEAELRHQSQHPLLNKYDVDLARFCIDATDALNNVVRSCDSDEQQLYPPSKARVVPLLSFARDAFSQQAFAVLQDVALGRAGIACILSFMKDDQDYFSMFGINMVNSCAVRRSVSFGHIRDARVYVCASSSPTEETIWGSWRPEEQSEGGKSGAGAGAGACVGDDHGTGVAESDEVERLDRVEKSQEEQEEERQEEQEEVLRQEQQHYLKTQGEAGGEGEREGGGDARSHVLVVANLVFHLETSVTIKYMLENTPNYKLKVSTHTYTIYTFTYKFTYKYKFTHIRIHTSQTHISNTYTIHTNSL